MTRTSATANKYQGKIAQTYDKQRVGKRKWEKEHEVVTAFLNKHVPTDELILDCPVGTGRFIPYYIETNRPAYCIDIQQDMLNLAAKKANKKPNNIYLAKGNILKLAYADNTFHTSLAIRIVNLLDTVDMQTALRELQRVSTHFVAFNIRVDDGSGKWRHPQPKQAVIEALLPNWSLWKNLEIHEKDFRLFVLKNGATDD